MLMTKPEVASAWWCLTEFQQISAIKYTKRLKSNINNKNVYKETEQLNEEAVTSVH